MHADTRWELLTEFSHRVLTVLIKFSWWIDTNAADRLLGYS